MQALEKWEEDDAQNLCGSLVPAFQGCHSLLQLWFLFMLNRIDYEEIKVDLSNRQHFSPKFAEINPMQQVPAIVDGRFKLFESHAILIYLACVFPGVADHWYPADLFRRAKIQSLLDWHHSSLRHGAVTLVLNKALAPALGRPLNPTLAAEGEKILTAPLSKLEYFWLEGRGKFLLGGNQPSIADISLVCELMQLEVMQWIEHTQDATSPHFDEVHQVLFKVKEKLKTLRPSESSLNKEVHSRM